MAGTRVCKFCKNNNFYYDKDWIVYPTRPPQFEPVKRERDICEDIESLNKNIEKLEKLINDYLLDK